MLSWFKQQKRIADLEKTVKDLSDRFEGLDSEWTDWYEKFRLLHMRLAKRQAREEQQSSREGGTQAGESAGGTSPGTALSPKSELIRRQIEAHRRANGGS